MSGDEQSKAAVLAEAAFFAEFAQTEVNQEDVEICRAACKRIIAARKQARSKHTPESWRAEPRLEQLCKGSRHGIRAALEELKPLQPGSVAGLNLTDKTKDQATWYLGKADEMITHALVFLGLTEFTKPRDPAEKSLTNAVARLGQAAALAE